VRARLYLDEDFVPDLARMLRAGGDDALSAHEIGALKWDDGRQLARATAEGRAVLTSNYADFLKLNDEWSRAGRSHAGIIISYHQYRRRELGALRRTVLAFLADVDAEQLRDTVLPLDPYRRDR